MDPVFLVYMPLFGLAVGSFLNLNIDRIPRGQSIVKPPSHCDQCQRRLAPLDLVPLLSYLWLRGRCRFCGAAIPRRAFLVEVVTGSFFGLVGYQFGLAPVAWVILAYGGLFIAISVIDLEWRIIPDKLVPSWGAPGLRCRPIWTGRRREGTGGYLRKGCGRGSGGSYHNSSYLSGLIFGL